MCRHDMIVLCCVVLCCVVLCCVVVCCVVLSVFVTLVKHSSLSMARLCCTDRVY